MYMRDREGRELKEGDIVFHDNGKRPRGTFRIEWDRSKVGFVLGGVEEHAEFWLRDWCMDHVTKVFNLDHLKLGH